MQRRDCGSSSATGFPGHAVVQSKVALNREMGDYFSRLADRISCLLRSEKDAGRAGEELDPDGCARMIVASVDGVILHAAIFGQEPRFVEAQKRELLNMIRRYTEETT